MQANRSNSSTHQQNPLNLIDSRTLANGQRLTLRPVQAEDAPLLGRLFGGLSASARQQRFHGAVKQSTSHLAQMCQVDGVEQLALVVSVYDAQGSEQLIADARYCADHDTGCAEFAVVVDELWARHGIASWALKALQQAALAAGLQCLDAPVMADNAPMLALMKSLGFTVQADRDDPRLVQVQRLLTGYAEEQSDEAGGFLHRLAQPWRNSVGAFAESCFFILSAEG